MPVDLLGSQAVSIDGVDGLMGNPTEGISIGVLILPSASWRQARDRWRLVDQLGFAHGWTYDHLQWRDLIGKTWFASMPTLAAAAAVTSDIRLGTLVCSPNFRHPVPLVKEALTLADISGHRFVLGMGAGAGGPDAEVLGVPPWSRRERTDRFAEFVELTDRLISSPVTDYAGRYYSARQARMTAGDIGRARVPLALAATGPRGMLLAAHHAEFWVTNGTSPAPGLVVPAASPQLVRRQVERLRTACRSAGRDPSTLRTLLLNVNRENPPLASVEAFRDAASAYQQAGITDMVVPFPAADSPFGGRLDVLEQISADIMTNPRIYNRDA